MSDEAPKPVPGPSKGISPIGVVLPAILAAAGAFGGGRLAGAHAAPAPSVVVVHDEPPPGPTLALEPFLLSVSDATKKLHAMKITVAVELRSGTKEEELKAFTPRVRDATLALLRGLSFEDAADPAKLEHLREELLERYKHVGVGGAVAVLVTDFVVQ